MHNHNKEVAVVALKLNEADCMRVTARRWWRCRSSRRSTAHLATVRRWRSYIVGGREAHDEELEEAGASIIRGRGSGAE
jgi:hypothetical protein